MATTEAWEKTHDLRKRPEGMTRDEWAAHKLKVAQEREAAKDPAAVAMGRKRMAKLDPDAKVLHARRAAKRRWAKQRKAQELVLRMKNKAGVSET